LLLYGGTGLGKTHLMHAAGNLMRAEQSRHARAVRALGAVHPRHDPRAAEQGDDQFKRQFRSVDALLIDDIQFFAGKDRTQEEFFHTFNALFEAKQQIIMTCDRYPKEVETSRPRLKSRFRLGLVGGDRAAGLRDPRRDPDQQGAGGADRPEEWPFIAKRMRSNVRELEGALNTRVMRARASPAADHRPGFSPRKRCATCCAAGALVISIANIQKTVADYYQGCEWRICCRSAAPVRWRARARWRWRWPRN
jgi:chromosomal replication initiator protein